MDENPTPLMKTLGGILFTLTTWLPALVIWVAYPVEGGVVRGFLGQDVSIAIFALVAAIGGGVGLSLMQKPGERMLMLVPGAISGAGIFLACWLYSSVRHSMFLLEIVLMIVLGSLPGMYLYTLLLKSRPGS